MFQYCPQSGHVCKALYENSDANGEADRQADF